MSDKAQKSRISQHWCPNLGAGVIVMTSGENESLQSKCLSSHLCGGEGAHCSKQSAVMQNTAGEIK